ncbi:MAG: sulfatase/phosphatase domain-containing protein, partial [Aggregatilineales bacterium]
LSYIKPHWPYIVPAPYHDMYSKDDILPVLRHDAELENAHPVHQAFLNRRVSNVFNRGEVRETVIPVYMGLIKQIDDQIGRLTRFLDESGQLDNTVIVFSSDHGDYLGDHWLGEKDYFHEQSIRVPLIIADPSPESDSTRGATEQRLVEYIDLVPTFVDLAGGDADTYEHKLEGRSLAPLLQGQAPDTWRDAVFVETDFNGTDASENINLPHEQKRATMMRTARYKYILHEAFPPQLFDLENDPEEFFDLGTDPAYVSVRAELHERLFHWFRHRKIRTTQPTSQLLAHGDSEQRAGHGIFIGYWSEDD